MTDVQLNASYLEDGIASINFFNGRVLTADDLRDEQAAETAHRRRLGRSVGWGVVEGLDVSRGPDGRSLMVRKGVAITPRGDVLELAAEQVRVPLVRPAGGNGAEDEGCADGDFLPCIGAEGGVTVSGQGAYLFALSSVSGTRGRATRVDFDTGGIAEDCGPRYAVEGIAFRLVSLDVVGLAQAGGMDADDLAVLQAGPQAEDRRKLQNVLAHLFLGTVASRALFTDPFRVGTSTGPSVRSALDELRQEGRLTDAEVPLAVVTWSRGSVDIADRWSVRRRPTPAPTLTPAWRALVGTRRIAEAEATFLQFQEQVARLAGPATSSADLAAIRAVDRFRYLPAAGLVPIRDGAARGFDESKFFDGVVIAAAGEIPGAAVEPLIRSSLAYPPVDLASGEAIFLYRVRENLDQIGARGARSARRFILFSSGSMPYHGRPPMEIQAVFPSGPLHPGDDIEIRGYGFGVSSGTARVFFDEIRVDPQPGSTDTRILAAVPETLEAPESGRQVSLKVESDTGSDSVMVTVIPRERGLSGQIDVDWVSVDPPTVQANQAASFLYRVTSRLSRTTDISIQVTVAPASLQGGIALLDLDDQEIEALDDVAIEESRDFRVRLDDVGSGALTITVTASAEGIAKSDVRTFEAGGQPPLQDEHIRLEFNSASIRPPDAGSVDFSTSTIALKPNAAASINATVKLEEVGVFMRTLDPSPGWQAEFVMVPDPIAIDAGDLEPDGVAGRPLDFAVMATAGASPTGTLTLAVQKEGAAESRTKAFKLQLIP